LKEDSGLKALLQEGLCFVGAASAATLIVIEDVRFGAVGAAFIGILWGLEEEFGAKAPPTKRPNRSGFRRGLMSSKKEIRGKSFSYREAGAEL
jgi:hypothetical protein